MYEYLEVAISLLFGLCVGVVLGIAFMQIKMRLPEPETEVPPVDHFENIQVTESANRTHADIVVIARRIEGKP